MFPKMVQNSVSVTVYIYISLFFSSAPCDTHRFASRCFQCSRSSAVLRQGNAIVVIWTTADFSPWFVEYPTYSFDSCRERDWNEIVCVRAYVFVAVARDRLDRAIFLVRGAGPMSRACILGYCAMAPQSRHTILGFNFVLFFWEAIILLPSGLFHNEALNTNLKHLHETRSDIYINIYIVAYMQIIEISIFSLIALEFGREFLWGVSIFWRRCAIFLSACKNGAWKQFKFYRSWPPKSQNLVRNKHHSDAIHSTSPIVPVENASHSQSSNRVFVAARRPSPRLSMVA